MKCLLVGHGAVGELIHNELLKNGFEVPYIVSPGFLNSVADAPDDADVIVDASHPDNLKGIIDYARKNKVPTVLGTTNYSAEQIEAVKSLSQEVPVVYTENFSLGVTVLNKVLKMVAPILRDAYDIEIIEKHHNKKLDSPSGTAKMLLRSVNDGTYDVVNGRVGAKRRGHEIGVHSVRGGTIAGEHSVIFAGIDEVLEFKHEAHSKMIFALGFVTSAKFILNVPKGLYNMENVLFGEK